MSGERIADTKKTVLSPWVTLLEKSVVSEEHPEPRAFHSFEIADYANVLLVTTRKTVVLVKQYRPGIECFTLELPGGLVEGAETVSERTVTELLEETGLRVDASRLKPLATLAPCPARLSNRIWGYFVDQVPWEIDPAYVPEPGVERVEIGIEELKQEVVSGGILNAQHAALIGIAVMKGWL